MFKGEYPGELTGVGLQIALNPKTELEVVAPIAGSLAEKVGFDRAIASCKLMAFQQQNSASKLLPGCAVRLVVAFPW